MENNDFDFVNPDGVAYVDIGNLINVFSSTEYDSLEKAAAEIVDNSIDANARNVLIILNSAYDVKKGKNVLSEIAFLDDGEGMSPGVLQHVVSFGSTSRTNGGKIGKFGIGMNQASLFACKKFSVYSWKNPNEVYVEVFDSVYIKKNKIDKALPPKKTTLPSYITSNVLFKKFENHGTLIVWTNFRENKMSKPVTIAKRMKNEFGRVYRYFLNSGEIHMYTMADQIENIHAIDPMFLLENTDVLGDPDGHSTKSPIGEPLFEPFEYDMLENGCKSYEVPYYDVNGNIKISNVLLKASIIKEKYYYQAAYKDNIKQPGDTEIGAYVKEFQKGITVVRNDREIDFNYFGFYDSTNQPQDRWFKIEISFTEELDEAFHVSNNKQHVELKKISDSKLPDYKENNPLYPMWLRLKKDIDKLLSAMRNRNRALASKAKAQGAKSVDNSLIGSNVEVKEESLDDILNSFSDKLTNKDNHEEKNNSINDNRVNNIELQNDKVAKEDSAINELELFSSDYNNMVQKDKPVSYLEKNVIVSYEKNIEDWITYEYDFELKQYFICFNSSMLNMTKMNSSVEYLIVTLCISICKETNGGSTNRVLKKLLDKYKKFLCGGI